jgi:hypothetical protein
MRKATAQPSKSTSSKSTSSKSSKSAAPAKLNATQSKVTASSHNATSTAQPGIIATIMQILLNAKQTKKPVSAAQIIAQLSKQFPQRAVSGMGITVRAQLSRLPREKQFAIVRDKSANVTTYSAA